MMFIDDFDLGGCEEEIPLDSFFNEIEKDYSF